MECKNCPDAEKCDRKLELAIAGVTGGWKCMHEFSIEKVIENLNALMERKVLSDQWTDLIDRAVELLKEQDELLRKLQKDKDKLCLEVSEWKHKFHDSPPKFVSQGVVDQICWERDTALSQLEQIGKGLGSKMDDVVALLKEQPKQEIVDPVKPIDVDDGFTWLCNFCNGELFCGDRIRDNYCPTCGRKIKWNGFC